jgi:hypothetical protein
VSASALSRSAADTITGGSIGGVATAPARLNHRVARPSSGSTVGTARIVEVRTSPRIGKKVWFGPHRIGWGLGPASIEGVATTIGFTVATSAIRKRNGGKRSPEELVLVALLLLIVFLKGTSPGGPKAYKRFEAAQSAQDD